MAALALEKDDEPDIFGDGEPAPTTPAAKPPAPPPDLSGKKTKAKTGKDAENQVDDRSAKATRRALNWQLAQAEDAQDKKCRDCKKFKPAQLLQPGPVLLQRVFQRPSELLESL